MNWWALVKKRSRYYIPVLKWLPAYQLRQDLMHDVVAGITVALLLIPQSLSYASGLARLDPVIGLYTSFIPVLIYGLLGTSRQLSVGPEALVSLLVGGAVGQIAGSNAPMEERLAVATALTLLVGIFTFILGILRLGFLDSVLSRALLRGFITAVACVILIEQLPPLLGIPHPGDAEDNGQESPFAKLVDVLGQLDHVNPITIVISVLSIIFLFGASRVKTWTVEFFMARRRLQLPRTESGYVSLLDNKSARRDIVPWYLRIVQFLPEILVVVGTTILFSYGLDLNRTQHVEILGDAALQTGFYVPRLPILASNQLKSLVTPAILIAVLGFVESIVVSKSFASKHQYTVSANRELVAFGTVNLLGSMFNCFPAFASIARSHVNDNAGAKTQLAGVVTGFIILLTILFILPIFYYLPRCVMASIVLVAAAGLLEFHDVIFMWRIRAWKDMALMMLTFIITIFWSVEAGTLISIGLSLILVVKHSTYPKISILGRVVETIGDDEPPVAGDAATPVARKVKYKPLEEIFQNPNDHYMEREDQEVLLVKVEESLFFANTGQMKDRLRRAEAYGGWLHIHPSEDERRPAQVKPSSSAVVSQKPSVECVSGASSSPSQLMSPALEATDGYPLKHQSLSQDEFADSSRFRTITGEFDDIRSNGGVDMSQPQLRAVIFDIENMQKIDASAIQILREIVEEYHSRQIDVCFVKLREANKPIFLRSGILGEVCGSECFFRKISDAMQFLRERWHLRDLALSPSSDRDQEANPFASPLPASSFSAYNVL